jgi:hypothetical protein
MAITVQTRSGTDQRARISQSFHENEPFSLITFNFIRIHFRVIILINFAVIHDSFDVWNHPFSTQYMRNPDIIYTLKMEYVSKNNNKEAKQKG